MAERKFSMRQLMAFKTLLEAVNDVVLLDDNGNEIETKKITVRHQEAVAEDLPVIIYRELELGQEYYDNIPVYKWWNVSVEFCTDVDLDMNFDKLIKLLDDNEITYEMNDVTTGTLLNRSGRFEENEEGSTLYQFVCKVM